MMNYPDWAPSDLVDEHRRHIATLERGPVVEDGFDDVGNSPTCPICGCLTCQCVPNGGTLRDLTLSFNFENTKASEPILRRMISDESMRTFWAWVGKQPLKDERRRENLPFAIWYQVESRQRQFERYPERTNTEKKKALNRIRKAAEALHAAILADDDAESYAASAMSSAMMDMNLRYRRVDLGLPPPSAHWDYEWPADKLEAENLLRGWYRFAADGIKVGRHLRDGDQEMFPIEGREGGGYLPWQKQPIEQRLAWWRIETEKISLIELLNYFANGIRSEAERQSAVKQRREDGGKNAFFIRIAASILLSHFQIAPPDRVADLAGAILDRPLARDDVRPYLR